MELAETSPVKLAKPEGKSIQDILTSEEIARIQQITQLERAHFNPSEIYAGDTAYDGYYNLAGYINTYTKNLLNLGVDTVNLVDFSAGGARTICSTANDIAHLVKAGRVHATATSLYGIPTLEGLQNAELKKNPLSYRPEHLMEVETALREGNAEFLRADILELYEQMKGKPVHLMFIMGVLPFTREFRGSLLKIVSEMLDREYGTLVASNLVGSGVNYLENKGFKQARTYSGTHGERVDVYQGPKAPSLFGGSVKPTEATQNPKPKNISFWRKLITRRRS